MISLSGTDHQEREGYTVLLSRNMSESLKTKAYEQIKSRILRCEYEPMSFLDVGAIANELGISRTPVRDAVSLLEQEELVQVLPRHGIMVLGISADLINDIINTRKIVEPFAARTAALKADEEIMNGIREVFCDPRADKNWSRRVGLRYLHIRNAKIFRGNERLFFFSASPISFALSMRRLISYSMRCTCGINEEYSDEPCPFVFFLKYSTTHCNS